MRDLIDAEIALANAMEGLPPDPSKRGHPVHEIHSDRIRAAIWRYDSKNGPKFYATFERMYLTESEEWRSSQSYEALDLLELAKVADLAHGWIQQQVKGDENS